MPKPRGTSPYDPRDAYDLSDRTAVVAGAASDIGAAIARAFAAVGARLVLGDLDAERLETVARSLREAGGEAEARKTDVTDAASVDALVAAAGPRLDVMVNLAGVIGDATVAETSDAELDRVLDVNAKGVFLGCRAAVRAMTPHGAGAIVNMASSGAYEPLPGLASYGMSKAAVVSLTRSLAAEVGRHGIRVNAVAPGYVEGGMSARRARNPDGSVDAARLEAVREQVRRRVPLGVLSGPEDVAHAVLYLASDASRTTTGQVLHPNGGRPMVS
jgi:3-oxoacyl-[acyl-carrier protein] reductase